MWPCCQTFRACSAECLRYRQILRMFEFIGHPIRVVSSMISMPCAGDGSSDESQRSQTSCLRQSSAPSWQLRDLLMGFHWAQRTSTSSTSTCCNRCGRNPTNLRIGLVRLDKELKASSTMFLKISYVQNQVAICCNPKSRCCHVLSRFRLQSSAVLSGTFVLFVPQLTECTGRGVQNADSQRNPQARAVPVLHFFAKLTT